MREYQSGDEPVPGYKLTKRRGSGAFGVVWEATGPGGVPCALKIISDLRNRGGSKEFKSLSLLREIRHINLVDIRGFWVKNKPGVEGTVIGDYSERATVIEGHDPQPLEHGDDPFSRKTEVTGSREWGLEAGELVIAMNLCDRSLEDELKNHPDGIPIASLIKYMAGAADAIDHVNAHGIQHCDIKPGNILLLGEHAQVCDFGLAQEIGDNIHATSIAASPAYGDPTVLEGDDPVNSTDLYCLAMTYAELRMGRLPFNKTVTRRSQVLKAKKQVDFDFTGIPEAEQEILFGALAPDPSDRTFSGEHKAKWFVEGLRSVTVEPAQPETQSSGLPTWIVGGIVAIFVLLGLAFFMSLPSEDDRVVVDVEKLLAKARYVEAAEKTAAIQDAGVRNEHLEKVANQWEENSRRDSDPSRRLQTYQRILGFLPPHQPTREARLEHLKHIAQTGSMPAEQVLLLAREIGNDESRGELDRFWVSWLSNEDSTDANDLLNKLAQRLDRQGDPSTGVEKLIALGYVLKTRNPAESLLEPLLASVHGVRLDDLTSLVQGIDEQPPGAAAIVDPIVDVVVGRIRPSPDPLYRS